MAATAKNNNSQGNLTYTEDIENRIKKARLELNSLFKQYDKKGINDEILEKSQHLDKLIVTYLKKLHK